MSDPTADEPTTDAVEPVAFAEASSSPAPAPEPAPAPIAPPIYATPVATPVIEQPLSLDEFMQNLSRADRRVSLVNAFSLQARVNALHRATQSEFQAAYVAFCNAPA